MEMKPNYEETYFKLCEGDILKLLNRKTDLAFDLFLVRYVGIYLLQSLVL